MEKRRHDDRVRLLVANDSMISNTNGEESLRKGQSRSIVDNFPTNSGLKTPFDIRSLDAELVVS